VFEITNKDNQNEINGYLPGVTLPGIELGEDYGNLGVLGERTDPLVERTINYILTGAKGGFNSQKKEHIKEISNSKLTTPIGNNMYLELK
tara:strand:- start:5288 stop:5557 length:270 start_codon:yes stop_codon:yes gene_type:complete